MPPKFKPGHGRHPKKTAMRDIGAGETNADKDTAAYSNGSTGGSIGTGGWTPDSVPSTPRKAAARAKRVAYALLHWDDLPAWRRDNAYILGGYRPTSQSYAASLASVAGIHNESVNIWTHLVGAVVAAVLGLALYIEVPTVADVLLGVLPEAAQRSIRRAAAKAGSAVAQFAADHAPSSISSAAAAWSDRVSALSSSGAAWAMSASGLSAFTLASDDNTASSTLVLTCFAAGAVACLGMSATYHALSNHSPAVARWGNKLDYSGIVFLIVGSYVPTLYYGFYCHPRWLTIYMYLISLLGLACLTVSWLEHFRTPAWRPYRALLFVGLGAAGIIPIAHSMLFLEDADTVAGRYASINDRIGLNWVLLQGAFYIFGAFLYAARWPERWWPGRFDIWGSSHQIFHVFVVLAAAAHLRGVLQSYLYHHNVMGAECPAPLG